MEDTRKLSFDPVHNLNWHMTGCRVTGMNILYGRLMGSIVLIEAFSKASTETNDTPTSNAHMHGFADSADIHGILIHLLSLL